MEKVTYIVPIHEYNEVVEKYLTRAFSGLKELKGAETYEVMLVGTQDVLEQAKAKFNEIGCQQLLTLVQTDEEDVFKKINLAVFKCVTPYFSVLEFDDDFYSYWDEIAQKELAKERCSVLLPIVEYVKTDNTVPSLGNELAWDAAFANDLGYINFEELKIFKDFNVTGGYLKTEDFITSGGLKPELKIASWYEYLLRMAHDDKKIKVLPRIGYMHTIFRDGSYMVKIKDELSQEDGAKIIDEVLNTYKD